MMAATRHSLLMTASRGRGGTRQLFCWLDGSTLHRATSLGRWCAVRSTALKGRHRPAYDAALRGEIARPLGLRTLGWCTDPAKDTMVATGHEYRGPGKTQRSAYADPSKTLGAGGPCSTAGDLGGVEPGAARGKVLSPSSCAALTTPRGVARGYG